MLYYLIYITINLSNNIYSMIYHYYLIDNNKGFVILLRNEYYRYYTVINLKFNLKSVPNRHYLYLS